MPRPKKKPPVFRLIVEFTVADDLRRERAVTILAAMYGDMLAERKASAAATTTASTPGRPIAYNVPIVP